MYLTHIIHISLILSLSGLYILYVYSTVHIQYIHK